MPNETGTIEGLLVSLIKMVGKNNEMIDELKRRVRQLEAASKEQQIHRVYSFIAEPPRPNSSRRDYVPK
ncbi:hypothetical protein [Mesobacillus subterraneus]|uniref:Uncharacterized protein n=1 Tax=Mesobacillus subterraneus TaxID=285983 RepID=A0A0D6Z6R1_9BACI|nr:hypothetical protein [Mesobacillus subterraneus]KIY20995.1 hypothetical protein UB32_16140 [Mesobacillus subterraneus]